MCSTARWRERRRGGLQLSQLRAAWGATGQLSGSWLELWVSVSGDAAQSASVFIIKEVFFADPLELHGHELEHLAVEGSALIANWTNDSGEVLSVGINFSAEASWSFFFILLRSSAAISRILSKSPCPKQTRMISGPCPRLGRPRPFEWPPRIWPWRDQSRT